MPVIHTASGHHILVDAADYSYLSQFKWHLTGKGYAGRAVNRKIVYMHREVIGAFPESTVDHINRNKLDNRRSNLRLATRCGNQRNRSAGSNNKSGYKGVSWDQTREKWHASIKVDGKTKNLGRFTNILEAVKAYNNASLQYHGEFSVLNPLPLCTG